MRQVLLLFLLIPFLMCEENGTISIPSNSSNKEEEEIFIPFTSTFDDSEEILIKNDQDHEEQVMPTTPDIPYLPLIQRCSTSSDCSSDKSCNDGKCLIPSKNKFDFLPVIFFRCQHRIECPSGNRCILNRCIPLHW